MSQPTKQRRTNKSSQPTSQRHSNEAENEENQLSQSQSDIDLSKRHDVVTYILTCDKSLIARQDIIKNVIGNHKHFNVVIKQATKILRDVYGITLQVVSSEKSKNLYAIHNHLGYVKFGDEEEDANDKQEKTINRLKIMILTHVFMSGNECPDLSLNEFLTKFDVEVHDTDDRFGNVAEIIKSMEKEGLLATEKNATMNKILYRWGAKAEATMSKMEILKMVAGAQNKNPRNYKTLYEAAEEQEEANKMD